MLPEVVKKRTSLGRQLGWKQCDLAPRTACLVVAVMPTFLFFTSADLGRIPLPT